MMAGPLPSPVYGVDGPILSTTQSCLASPSLRRNPNELLEKYHDRMPVILKLTDNESLLSGNRIPSELLRPYDADAMSADCADLGTAVTAQEPLFSTVCDQG